MTPSFPKVVDPDEPALIASVLHWRKISFAARLLLCSAYLLGGFVKATDWTAAVAEQAHFNMHPPAFWAGLTILVELIGPLLILSGRFVWLGAGMLAVLTGLASLVANAFWTMPAGAVRFAATNGFFEHLGLIGGFILVALVTDLEKRDA